MTPEEMDDLERDSGFSVAEQERETRLAEPVEYRYMDRSEIDTLIAGWTEAQLRENAARAARQPGTTWDVTLRAELRRRGLS